MSVTISKKKRTKEPICSFLRKLISPYSFGWEEDDGVGRYSNDLLIKWYNTKSFMGTPSNSDYYAHFAGQATLYFWADGRKSSPQTISMIDIDCHKKGNPQSATAFADWLKDNYFPNLYHEPSTHGKGRHGYFVLFKEGFKDVGVSNALKQLDKILKKLLELFLATHPQHDVENVEIKGTPHIMTWAKGGKRQIETMKSGCLAKLPRDIFSRFDEFKNTTVMSLYDIDDLEEKVDRIVIPAPKRVPIIKIKGSTSAHPITRDEVEAISGPYLEFARSWIPEAIGTSSRARVDAIDLAIALSILKFCSQHMNSDGTMPTNRIKRIWDGLFETGEVQRAFDYHRWRVIRDLIEGQGGLEMKDRVYYTGFVNDQGHEIKGRAAKWKMANWLVEQLDQCIEFGYVELQDSSLVEEKIRPLLNQVIDSNQSYSLYSSLVDGGERALLEQELDQEDDYGFDREWIKEFRQSMPPLIGLIWGGSIENKQRETG
jgi:hypothetical protein